MSMIRIDTADPHPIYEQIIEQYSRLLFLGVIPKDEPLPSVRTLAMELSVNPNTVQRAYQELERQGYIYSIRGKGSFAADPKGFAEKEMEKLLVNVDASIRQALAAGITKVELQARISQLLSDADGENS